jgi:hypothetical protein
MTVGTHSASSSECLIKTSLYCLMTESLSDAAAMVTTIPLTLLSASWKASLGVERNADGALHASLSEGQLSQQLAASQTNWICTNLWFNSNAVRFCACRTCHVLINIIVLRDIVSGVCWGPHNPYPFPQKQFLRQQFELGKSNSICRLFRPLVGSSSSNTRPSTSVTTPLKPSCRVSHFASPPHPGSCKTLLAFRRFRDS